MADKEDQIRELDFKLNQLLTKQATFAQEIQDLRRQIEILKYKSSLDLKSEPAPKPILETATEAQASTKEYRPAESIPKKKSSPSLKLDIERFIGENLINKIGILLTIIGVVIGGKYAVDNNLISPVMRLVLAYLLGGLLLGLALKLKAKYLHFSAVLLGGALAIFYFMSFAAYTFFDLFPKGLSFALMLVVTVGAVYSALKYKQELIAILGLVGAYAIPFLVSTNQGSALLFFTYVILINLGILFIAFQRYWKILFYSAFGVSWLIFLFWYVDKFSTTDLSLGLAVSFAFYLLFFTYFLAYKLRMREKFKSYNLLILFSNNIIFFAFGAAMLKADLVSDQYLGAFTFFLALLNGAATWFISRSKDQDQKLYHILIGISLFFVALSIPNQFDGPVIAIAWSAQAAILFWISRRHGSLFFEYFSYPLFILAFLRLWSDWPVLYQDLAAEQLFLLNLNFLYSFLFILSGFAIFWINRKYPEPQRWAFPLSQANAIKVLIGLSLFSTYFAFRWEMVATWARVEQVTAVLVEAESGSYTRTNPIYDHLSWLSDSLLPLFFALILQYLNFTRFRDRDLGRALILISWISVILFCIMGLYNLGELSDLYLWEDPQGHFTFGAGPMLLRYPAFILVTLLLYLGRKSTSMDYLQQFGSRAFEIFMHLVFLILISSELLHWLNLADYDGRYRLIFTILVGSYAFFLIWWGMKKNRKHLRLTAMILFALVILKLLIYDLGALDTLSKTIVLVAIGALLLLSSFWYNRQKRKMEP
ncbi:MAG: DUF2339 domain-containing protein [Bacteroidetes bacterium]|nr:DUF2339 domain-containing protein [Bacteroidota bacterium]